MRALAVAAGLVLLAGPAGAWRYSTRGSAAAVAVAPAGDVVVAGTGPGRFPAPHLAVVRLTPGGRVRWRFRNAFGDPRAVVRDGAGDVVLAGDVVEGLADGRFFSVLTLDGARGTQRWQTVLGAGAAQAVAVDAAGDVTAAGGVDLAFAAARLRGGTGEIAWRRTFDGAIVPGRTNAAGALAVDAAGDAVAAGSLAADLLAVKLAARDGATRWQVTVPGAAARAVALAADGDAIVGGTTGNILVLRLAAADGGERWRTTIARGTASAVTVDAAGDVVVAGQLDDGTRRRFVVLKLAGATGAERWRQTIGDGSPADEARAVAVDAAGMVIAASTSTRAARAFTIAAFDGVTGTLRWSRGVAAPAQGIADGVAVALDAQRHVVAVGSVARPGAPTGRGQHLVALRLPPR